MENVKTVRLIRFQEVLLRDHMCDKLPEHLKKHTFKIEFSTEERRLFSRKKEFFKTCVCPYCNKEISYKILNIK